MAQDRFLGEALCFGYERMSAWADLLDRINVFPIADADTGTNLKISLAPLRQPTGTPSVQAHHLMQAATGNSGNIASAFFSELLGAQTPADLAQCIAAGQLKARQAVGDPQPGTMLTVFDALAHAVSESGWDGHTFNCKAVVDHLERTVAGTCDMLPVLAQAGVVDAGALGMFIFLEAYFAYLFDPARTLRPVTDIFPDKLTIRADWQVVGTVSDHCVNTLLHTDREPSQIRQALAGAGESVVVTRQDDRVKLHLHTRNPAQLRERLSAMGQVKSWDDQAMEAQVGPAVSRAAIHIMTDAAGSFTLEDARKLDVTLLNSYLVLKERTYAETAFAPTDLYAAMAAGTKVSTAQASLFERQQSYLSATQLHDRVLYLCVGSVYTGNFETATAWQSEQGAQERFDVIDTGAASGRLGIAALAVARRAQTTSDYPRLRAFAQQVVARSQEFVFLEQLKYLAAGGRISKTKGFFGDLLHLKPVITPTPHGAAKVAVVRNRDEQLTFARQHLTADLDPSGAALILLQYSDNQAWVENTAAAQMAALLPRAEILIRPLSLTSGAHMGPGTWAVAYLPPLDRLEGVV